MGSSKRSAPAAATAAAKERYRKAQRMQFDPKAPLPPGLVAKPTVPKLKHRTYFEIMENKDKKKKLEFQVTTDRNPPPGFEFVPMGNPLLTAACKELSREKEAMIFIVSNLKDPQANSLGHQVHRIGHHIRQSIVEEAKAQFDVLPVGTALPLGAPEPIPPSQRQYNAQVDAAIRDLFPRIPNTDRQIIIEHAFDLTAKGTRKGEKPVGLSTDITLARRVQLAVLAHIRHAHTRYDELLRETTWHNARRVVESLCLDILVKWRGDEETGRDQLDDILQEVVVISDSEDNEDDDDDDDDADVSSLDSDDSLQIISPPHQHGPRSIQTTDQSSSQPRQRPRGRPGPLASGIDTQVPELARVPGKKEQRGFKRYRAWQEAIQRNRAGEGPSDPPAHTSFSHTLGGHGAPLTAAILQPHSEVRFGGTVAAPGRGHHHSPSLPFPQSGHVPSEGLSLRQAPQVRMESVPPPRPRSPPIQDRFKDLLVRSIEPTSPQGTQPSFIRAIPSRSPDPRTLQAPYDDAPHRPPQTASPLDLHLTRGHALPHRRVISDQMPQDPAFPGGFIQVAHRRVPGAHSPHPQWHMPPSRQAGGEPAIFQPRTRPRETDFMADDRPAKRALLGAPPVAQQAPQYTMEDRGGFLEKVPLPPSGSRSVPPDPGFIEIRRPPAEFEADRVISYEEGRRLRYEPGVEVIPIASRPMMHPDHVFPGPQRPIYHPRDHVTSFHGPVPEAAPLPYSRQQEVFRYVRGNDPGGHQHAPHQSYDENRPPHRGSPRPHEPTRWVDRPSGPVYGIGPDGRPLGRHSHTPIVLD